MKVDFDKSIFIVTINSHLLPGGVKLLLEFCLWRHPPWSFACSLILNPLFSPWSLILLLKSLILDPLTAPQIAPLQKDPISFQFFTFWEYFLIGYKLKLTKDQQCFSTKHYPVRERVKLLTNIWWHLDFRWLKVHGEELRKQTRWGWIIQQPKGPSLRIFEWEGKWKCFEHIVVQVDQKLDHSTIKRSELRNQLR